MCLERERHGHVDADGGMDANVFSDPLEKLEGHLTAGSCTLLWDHSPVGAPCSIDMDLSLYLCSPVYKLTPTVEPWH